MIVTAMLAWFQEPPELLDACVRSLEGFCDRIVAVDGAYDLTPGKAIASAPGQAEAIERAARAVGIEAAVHVPGRIWHGQVQKRDAMLRLAAAGSDYLFACDADYVVSCEPSAVRAELADSDADAFRVRFHTPIPDGFDVKRESPHAWHRRLAGKTTKIPLLFRRHEAMRIERRHFWYSGVKDGRRIALFGCGRMYPRGVTRNLQAPFRIDHVCFARTPEALERNRLYCELRDAELRATGIEA